MLYRVLICDDNPEYVKSLRHALNRLCAYQNDYRIDITGVTDTLQAREAISAGDYDIITLDTSMRDESNRITNHDYLRSRLSNSYHGSSLVQYAQESCRDAQIFVISRIPVHFSKEEFNYANAEYFCKAVTPVERIAGRIINYFDTNKQRFLNNVFIVYGHHSQMHTDVRNHLRELQLNVTDLNTSSRSGITTVFDILEECSSKAECAIVLLSGDDRAIVYDENQEIEVLKYRARQNVIFEMGMFAGVLGRDKVIVLHEKKPHFEFPSDIHGVFYVEYDNTGNWKQGIRSHLNKMGFNLM